MRVLSQLFALEVVLGDKQSELLCVLRVSIEVLVPFLHFPLQVLPILEQILALLDDYRVGLTELDLAAFLAAVGCLWQTQFHLII